jgi:transcriptional regulator with XRE-family HTH domain
MSFIGLRVKELRLVHGWTVRELAFRAHVSVSYLYAVEAGERGKNITHLKRIADALGVSMSDLVAGDEI